MDGLERNRRKWSAIGRLAYRVSETLSAILPDAVVTDARVIQDYYKSRHRCDSTFIPYGGDLPQPAGRGALDRLGLAPEKYVLYVSRLEPENNAEEVVREGTLEADAIVLAHDPAAQAQPKADRQVAVLEHRRDQARDESQQRVSGGAAKE